MASTGSGELIGRAFSELAQLGFRCRTKSLPGVYSKSVFCLDYNGRDDFYLVQTRGFQEDTARYLFGIMVEPLAKVNGVILYCDGENKIPVIPADFMRTLFQKECQLRRARFSGRDDGQWRINLHLDEEKISSQGALGERHSIASYIHRLVSK